MKAKGRIALLCACVLRQSKAISSPLVSLGLTLGLPLGRLDVFTPNCAQPLPVSTVPGVILNGGNSRT